MTHSPASPLSEDNSIAKFSLLGLSFPALSYQGLQQELLARLKRREKTFCLPINTDLLRMTIANGAFHQAAQHAHLVFADGMPVVWLSKLTGRALPERIPGCDMVYDLCKLSGTHQYNIYILGAGPGVAQRAKETIEARYPDARIVGVYSPSFKELQEEQTNQAIIQEINAKQTDVLFVALGAPKQELWIDKHLHAIHATLIFPCGGSIDFIAGEQKKAPKWIGKLGLEWVFRLLSNPQKFYRRYLLEDIPFSLNVLVSYAVNGFSIESLTPGKLLFR